MIVQTWFDRKPERYARPPESVVEKMVELSAAQFAAFLNEPLMDQTFISENVELMHHDGERDHCLLVLEQGKDDGLLVQSEGFSYARYAAYLPSARIILNAAVEQAAELIVRDGTDNTPHGMWRHLTDSLYQQTGLVAEADNGIGPLLVEALRRRPEVKEVELHGKVIELRFHLDHCKNLSPEHQPEETAAQRQERLSNEVFNYLGEHNDSSELYRIFHDDLGMTHEEIESLGFDLAHCYEKEPGISGPRL